MRCFRVELLCKLNEPCYEVSTESKYFKTMPEASNYMEELVADWEADGYELTHKDELWASLEQNDGCNVIDITIEDVSVPFHLSDLVAVYKELVAIIEELDNGHHTDPDEWFDIILQRDRILKNFGSMLERN